MRRGRPLRTRSRLRPVNSERRATLSEVQFGSDAFGAWCHRQACQIPGCDARDVEQAHARSRAAGGDWTDIAILCREHHHEQHQLGILTFEAKYGVDLRALAREVQRAWTEREGAES